MVIRNGYLKTKRENPGHCLVAFQYKGLLITGTWILFHSFNTMKILFQSQRRRLILLLSISLLVFQGCASVPERSDPPLQTVPHVDLERYLGKWHEIARYPHSFQEGCFGSTAEYSMNEDGSIKVVNRCIKGHPTEGEPIEAIGEAVVEDAGTNAKLKVSFFWPFQGDYWIIGLGKNYEYAIVSEPHRQYLWILSRTPVMQQSVLESLKTRLKDSGFDLTYLMETQITAQSK